MMLFNYESELYPVGHEELRKEEPARKRSKKSEYRLWVTRTHDLNELINAIIQELQSR